MIMSSLSATVGEPEVILVAKGHAYNYILPAESVDRYSVQTQGLYFILKRIWAIDRTQHENV